MRGPAVAPAILTKHTSAAGRRAQAPASSKRGLGHTIASWWKVELAGSTGEPQPERGSWAQSGAEKAGTGLHQAGENGEPA